MKTTYQRFPCCDLPKNYNAKTQDLKYSRYLVASDLVRHQCIFFWFLYLIHLPLVKHGWYFLYPRCLSFQFFSLVLVVQPFELNKPLFLWLDGTLRGSGRVMSSLYTLTLSYIILIIFWQNRSSSDAAWTCLVMHSTPIICYITLYKFNPGFRFCHA